MKKIISVIIAFIVVFCTIPFFGVSAADNDKNSTVVSNTVYTDHLTNDNKKGYDYDITDSSIAWVKQATGAIIWVTENDTRSDNQIIAQAKSADSSLANATKHFAVMKGEGNQYTPNTNGSRAIVNVYTSTSGKLIMSIEGAYSHFVSGTSVNNNETVDSVNPPATSNPETDESEIASIKINTPKKMAVKFADGTVYYDGQMKEIVIGEEYMFQMVSVNWENGQYDENGNGICGTVVYKMKAINTKEFNELRKEALKDTERYTIKGIDIIDNDSKTIVVNCDSKDFHLETDVNSFFVAYRFHFNSGDYNKQTGTENVVNNPTESLSVNLPLGTSVACDAYKANQKLGTENVFITRNNGEGKYADEYLTSVNDYYWNY